MEKDTIILTDESKEIIRSSEFAKRLTNLVKTLTERGALKAMARDKARIMQDLKGRGMLDPAQFVTCYIEVLEKRSDYPRRIRDVFEMLGNTVLESIAPGSKWEEKKG